MPSATTLHVGADPHRPVPDAAIPSHPPDLSKQLPKLIPRRAKPSVEKATSSVPETPSLPDVPSLESIRFILPTRRILSPQDHELFLKSPTHTLILAFIFTISDSVKDTPITAIKKEPLHPCVEALLEVLDLTCSVLEDHPPEDTGSRFGNPIFRKFLSSVTEQARSWHTARFPSLSAGALDEAETYFVSSFGSGLRIDYGSGHELNFLMYLLCLHRLGLLPPSTFSSLALVLFPKYLALMRSVQTAYYLEPAGSHGVWGLDDYHFLPFLFGSSQLQNHPFIRPRAIHSEATLEAYGDDFLYLDMVRQVNATKTVQGLRWHSPMLDDISGVREGWGKIYGGMKKMFTHEVVGKLVVMQHFLFGRLIPAAPGMTEASYDEEEEGTAPGDGERRVSEGHDDHAHNADSWGDCCGIKVPSSIGATQEMKKRVGTQGLRRLPFD